MQQKITTMKYQVYKIIKANVANGTYPHGEQLQELEIAKTLNVSRSPVREALKQLVGEGLLVDVPNKGVFVRKLTPHQISNVFEIRKLFERYALEKQKFLPTKALKDDLKQMRDILISLDLSNIDYVMDNEVNPHLAIVKSSGNEFIVNAHHQACTMSMMLHFYMYKTIDIYRQTVKEHMEIIDAVLVDNYDEAVRLIEEHLDINCKAALDLNLEYHSGI